MPQVPSQWRWHIAGVLTLGVAIVAVLSMFSSVANAGEPVNIPELMIQRSVNLVLSVAEVEKSKEFYGDVLALRRMSDLHLPRNFVMTRYQVGTTEIKFLHTKATTKTETGRADAAIGIRRLRLFFADEQALRKRFESHDLQAPRFSGKTTDEAGRSAVVSDPDGNELELTIVPEGSSDDALNNIELGLTVGDIEKSRGFYRDFIGFDELDPRISGSSETGPTYRFRYGNTTLRISSFGDELPKHSGRWAEAHGMRYIQYIVRDLDAVSDYAKSSGVTIEQEIFPLGGLARIMFLADPDGIINEFVGLPK